MRRSNRTVIYGQFSVKKYKRKYFLYFEAVITCQKWSHDVQIYVFVQMKLKTVTPDF